MLCGFFGKYALPVQALQIFGVTIGVTILRNKLLRYDNQAILFLSADACCGDLCKNNPPDGRGEGFRSWWGKYGLWGNVVFGDSFFTAFMG